MRIRWNWVANFCETLSQVWQNFSEFLWFKWSSLFIAMCLRGHFVLAEAVQRAAAIAEAEGTDKIEATHLERILPQLLLDFWGILEGLACICFFVVAFAPFGSLRIWVLRLFWCAGWTLTWHKLESLRHLCLHEKQDIRISESAFMYLLLNLYFLAMHDSHGVNPMILVYLLLKLESWYLFQLSLLHMVHMVKPKFFVFDHLLVKVNAFQVLKLHLINHTQLIFFFLW